MEACSVGVVGLAVMGQNLALNLADHTNRVAVFNRTSSVTAEFISGQGESSDVIGFNDLQTFVDALVTPRIVIVMVKAGSPVDSVLDQLIPLLNEGDVVIDGGNSLYIDTERRVTEAAKSGISYIGAGVSGGEEGARHGPSIMPGGDVAAWGKVAGLLQSIAATTPDGTPCCDWIGPGGSGHYVKMIHNGIEYGDMQVIAEAYHLMRIGLGLSNQAMADVFESWNDGVLDSYLIEITAQILRVSDKDGPRVDSILDAAGQKGTGKWTVISSMELGQPTTLVAEAVYARIVSSFTAQRKRAATVFAGPDPRLVDVVVDDIHDALYASKIVSYAQGFGQIAAAATEYGWELDLGRIAQLWRAGCIIRARFLDDITAAYQQEPSLEHLMFDAFFADALSSSEDAWRRVVAGAFRAGLPVPAYATALSYFDAFRSEKLPANLIQAQRDFFGAHTYERVDRPRGEFFHTVWADGGLERPVG